MTRRLGAGALRTVTAALVVTISLVAAGAAQAAAPASTPLERVRALVQPSIVYLEITWQASVYDASPPAGVIPEDLAREDRDPKVFELTSQCTGFFVSPRGHVATAGHCVEESSDIREALLAQAAEFTTTCGCYYRGTPSAESVVDDYQVRNLERTVTVAYGTNASGLRSGTALPALVEVIRGAERDTGDVALLKIEAQDVPALRLAPDATVRVGTDVVAIGYPASVDYVTDNTFDPSFKDGSISSLKTIEGGLLRVYEISAAVSGGMSGGPTVNLAGDVIGVNSFGIRGETQAFNFVRPASIVTDVLKDKGVRNELGATGRQYREGVRAYFAGDRAEALEKLDAVLVAAPSHQLAQEYRTRARALPEEESGFPLWILGVVAGAVVLAGLIAGVWLLARRGRGGPAPAPAAFAQPPPAPAPAPGAVAQPPAVPRPADRAATRAPARPAPPLSPPSDSKPAVVVRDGPLAGKRFLVDGELLLGRENADVLLEDPEASRRHALLRNVGGELEVSDLRSANGTYVDGVRIGAPTRARHGAVIRVGNTSLDVDAPHPNGPATTVARGERTVLHQSDGGSDGR